MRRRQFIGSALGYAACLPAAHALGQGQYPNQPITLVVPFAPGGGGDVIARLLAKHLAERIRVSIVVENKAGASGNIGATYALRAKADGYTMLSLSATYAIQAALFKPPFDPIADMQPLVAIARDPALLIVPANSRFASFKDLLAEAKANPGKVTYGSAGPGSTAHIGVEDLAARLGLDLTHVPYKGTSQAFNDLLGGRIDTMYTSVAQGVPYVRAGQIRALAVAATERLPSLPDTLTFIEQGAPDYVLFDWKALALPRGVAVEIVTFLNRTINEVIRDSAFSQRLEAEGTTIVGGSPDDMLRLIRADIDRWKALAQRTKLRLE